jgi:D-galactonate transporter
MQATNTIPAVRLLGQQASSTTEATYRKITRRLIPLLFFCYVLNYIDRINIGYAQLQMKQALDFSDAIYGLGAGVFFLGYFLLEVPSNLLLQKIGARKTMLRIMLCWGIVSAATMFVTTPMQFYVARFLLGVFEAGFFPGIVLYLTFWYPPARRARIVALFMMATVVAGIIAGPLSGWILQNMNGVHGLQGWQWMFVLEGLPSCVLGVVAYVFLDDKPSDAKWLSEDEKELVIAELAAGPQTTAQFGNATRQAFLDPLVYLLCFASFTILCGGYAISFWLPTLIRGMGVADLQKVGLYSVVPYAVGAFAMVWFGKHSDSRQERRWHFAVAAAMGALGLVGSTFTSNNLWLSIGLLAMATAGIVSSLPVFWAVATSHLSKASAAAGIAIITSVSNLAGVASPYALGLIKTSTGSLTAGLYVVAALLLVGAMSILLGIEATPRAHEGVSR